MAVEGRGSLPPLPACIGELNETFVPIRQSWGTLKFLTGIHGKYEQAWWLIAGWPCVCRHHAGRIMTKLSSHPGNRKFCASRPRWLGESENDVGGGSGTEHWV